MAARPLFAEAIAPKGTVLLSDLSDRIRTTLPLDKPGTLSRQQAGDVLAYMLSLSKIPAGTTPLPADALALGQIKYVSYPPQR